MSYQLIEINDNIIQIYGEVNGFARKRQQLGKNSYVLDICFFVNQNHIHITTNNDDNTISSLFDVKNRIDHTIQKEMETSLC